LLSRWLFLLPVLIFIGMHLIKGKDQQKAEKGKEEKKQNTLP